jgi:hypothetical protein
MMARLNVEEAPRRDTCTAISLPPVHAAASGAEGHAVVTADGWESQPGVSARVPCCAIMVPPNGIGLDLTENASTSSWPDPAG